MCDNGHNECIGPICTVNSSPKRALTGAAKDKATIFAKIKDICYHVEKQTSTSAIVRYSRLESALFIIPRVKEVIDAQTSWHAEYSLWTVKGDNYVKVSLTRIKS